MATGPDLSTLTASDREFILRVSAMQTALIVRALSRAVGISPDGAVEDLAQEVIGSLRHFANPSA